MATNVSYKNNSLTSFNSGTKILKTAGKYMEDDVTITTAAGSAGTPTATKGSVSNHAVTVTPSVINTTGYITGGTKTGTAVTVSASELVSGTKSITQNGTGIDVINYASVNVNVPSDDFIITFAKNQNDEWIPDCTYTQAYSAYSAGKTIAVTTGGDEAVSINVVSDMGFIDCRVYEPFDNVISSSLSNIGAKVTDYTWSSRGMSENYSYITYEASSTDAVPSDVANGKLFVNSQGLQTGTMSSQTYVNGDNLAYGGN